MSKHAYLIAAYENFDVLEVLMRLVDDERNGVFLHVDKKARGFDPARFSNICQAAEFHLAPRMNVYWADYTQIESAIALMRMALRSGKEYEYFHFLSDSDLPIKTQDEIHDFVGANAGSEFVAFNKAPVWAHDWLSYYYPLNRFLRARNRTVRAAYKSFRHYSLSMQRAAGVRRSRDIEIKYGSDYFSISRDLSEYVVSREEEIARLFRLTFLPSEFYLQTIVWNSHFRDHVFDMDNPYRSNLRHIDFPRGTGSSPHVFDANDFDELVASDRLFARKFSTEVDKSIIEAVSARLQ